MRYGLRSRHTRMCDLTARLVGVDCRRDGPEVLRSMCSNIYVREILPTVWMGEGHKEPSSYRPALVRVIPTWHISDEFLISSGHAETAAPCGCVPDVM